MSRLFLRILVICLVAFNNPSVAQNVTPCLISSGIVRDNCGSVGDPYIGNPCIAGIQKQIARSVSAESLIEWIFPWPCYGWLGTNGVPNNGNLPPDNAQVNCTPPYNKCWSTYCPDKYCSIIKSFVDLKASIILRAVNTWDKHGEFKPGTVFYSKMKQIVIDINAAYDCAGIRRPVIQGAILENVGEGVNYVPIPADVINAFKTEPGFDNSYYLNALGYPKILNFKLSRIIANTNFPNSPKIVNIEARMWFYYLAKTFIDLGYKSIHMGQMSNWSQNDNGYVNTTRILNKIRSYAYSKGTFVLLTEENYKAIKFPGTNTFMYDYDSRALRPREVSTPSVCGDYNCSNSVNNYLAGSPCGSEPFPAIIDQCVVSHNGNTNGFSPLNGCVLEYQPYNTYFDYGAGNHEPVGQASSGCNGREGTWGWEDTKWFGYKINTTACRNFWMKDAIARLRTYHNSFGFMTVPGSIIMKMPELHHEIDSVRNPTADGRYVLADEPDVLNGIKQVWTPNSYAGVSINKQCKTLMGFCLSLPPKRIRQNKYTFNVTSPDNSTFYTWHMQDPNGNWLNFTNGVTREFYPFFNGIYTIYLRQDNLAGYMGSTHESVKTISYKVFLFSKCCGNNVMARGSDGPPYEEDYEGEITKFEENKDFSAYDKYINDNMAYYKHPDSLSYEDTLVFAGNKQPTSTNTTILAQQKDNRIEIYPNPTNNFIFVKSNYGFSQTVEIRILDVTGREIQKITNAELSNKPLSIPLDNFATGTYFINIINKENSLNERYKFIKQ